MCQCENVVKFQNQVTEKLNFLVQSNILLKRFSLILTLAVLDSITGTGKPSIFFQTGVDVYIPTDEGS